MCRFCDPFRADSPCVGLLVAACVNRAPPGTFGAAVAEVGVLDMLKVLRPLPPSRRFPWCLVIANERRRVVVQPVHDRARLDFRLRRPTGPRRFRFYLPYISFA